MAGPGQQAAERTDPGSRASNSSSGKSSGSAGPGAYNGQGRPNTPSVAQLANGGPPAGTQTSPGLKATGKVTTYGAPVRVNALGVETALGPSQWGAWQDQVDTYNKAAQRWNASAQQPSLSNLVNNSAPMGLSMQPPDINRPATYTGGDYHLGLNPAQLAGGLLGMYGSGFVTGPIAGSLYTKAGGQNAMLSGPAAPSSWNWGGPQGQGQPAAPQQAGPNLGQQNGAGDHLQQLAALNSQIPGNPGAPTSSGTATPPGLPGPNYSQMLGKLQQITPGYGVQLPGYQYSGRATV